MINDRKILIEKTIMLMLITYTIISFITNSYLEKANALILLILNIYLVIRNIKNKSLFFIFIILFYFNYSFIISKYLGDGTANLNIVYTQLVFENTKGIGITILLLFFSIIGFCLNKNKNYSKDEIDRSYISNTDNKNELALLIITILLLIIIIGYLVLKLSISRQIYEYALILFIFGFFYSKNNKKYRYIMTILMVLSTVINMINGGRIISLQPMIAWVFICYFDKFSYKKICLTFIIGVFVFTIAGLYGDFKEYGLDFNDLNLSYINTVLINRKFALDTSISSYWTGLTFIEMTNILSIKERLMNFLQYITMYTILGWKKGYIPLTELALNYYTHYNGGFITSYFYFWLGVPGVMMLGVYISKFLNMINNTTNKTEDLKKIIGIYFISTISRWYLYFPTTLIRGLIILIVLYIVLNKIFRLNGNNDDKRRVYKC